MSGIVLTIDVDDRGTVHIKQFSDEAKKAFKEMEDGPKQAQGPLDALRESWIGFTAKIGVAIAALYTAKRMFYDTAREAASLADEIKRQADVLGISTDEIQKWRYAAKMADVNTEELAIGIKLLSRNLEDASQGTGDALKYLSMMGISVKDVNGDLRPLNDIMGDIMDKFASWEDGPRKIAIAMTLFGRSGETLIHFLNQGRSALENFGNALSPDLINKGSEADTQFKKLKESTKQLGEFFALYLMPVQQFGEAIEGSARTIIDFYSRPEVKEFFEFMKMLGTGTILLEGMKKPPSMTEWFEKPFEIKPPALGEDSEKLRKQLQEEAELRTKINEAMNKAAGIGHEFPTEEEQVKMELRSINNLLEDQKNIREQILGFQKQLNESQQSAVEIMDRLEIPTMTSFKGWTEGLVKEYETVLGADFSESAIAEAKQRYIDALNWAKEKGGYSTREYIDEINKTIKKIDTMKPADTPTEKARKQIIQLENELKNYTVVAQKASYMVIEINGDPAELELDWLEKRFDDFRERIMKPIPVTMEIMSPGSGLIPIMDKIEEIYGGFENMQVFLSQMEFRLEMGTITDQIALMQKTLAEASMTSPSFWVPGAYYAYQKGMLEPQIAALQRQASLLYEAQAAFKAGGNAGAQGASGAGFSISIGQINVIGGSDMQIAIKLDSAIADLIEKDRSKIKDALGK